ncbi:MAG: UDP-N-acetylmuramoyl-tripeptide--D-alanyl-D-alanine ligase [Nocardioidaceae bacterium]|nr:UDP-N-acetylmuramoyl-tripeptide--D-alanyl-D-alanine ligase [Nocardioidaceae bacterium]
MIPLSLAEVAAAVGGRLEGADPAALVTAPAAVDSRSVTPGGLFVAVHGAHVDGHDYADRAAAAGAVAVLAERLVAAPAVVVDDTTLALGRLAALVRTRLTGCTVVGLTGSQGKTGTKDLLAHLLASAGSVVAPAGSFNNELGVPLTVLRADAGTDFLVSEMGARGHGQIRYLCGIVEPAVGLVLNVGVAHVGEFGSQADIALAKGELVEQLPADGTAVLNADDPLVAPMAARTAARVVTFGESSSADVQVLGLHVDGEGRPAFDLATQSGRVSVEMRLLGAHQASNAAAAAAVALTLGVPLPTVATSLASAEPSSRWRMERHERADGVTVINDAYNANPDSVRAAVRTLASVRRGGARTVAVLGEMLELGASGPAEHEAVGALAARLGIDRLVVVGEGAHAVHAGAQADASWRGESVQVADADGAIAVLASLLPGDVVLVKASRGVGLERVAAALLADRRDTAPSDSDRPAIPRGDTTPRGPSGGLTR